MQASQSHNMHRVVGFEPLAPAAFFVRIILTFMGAQQVMHWPPLQCQCLPMLAGTSLLVVIVKPLSGTGPDLADVHADICAAPGIDITPLALTFSEGVSAGD